MKKLFKQLICFVLIFIAAFSCFGNSDIIDDIMIIADAVTTASGTCGENVTWSFDADTATLTISGSGDMPSYDGNSYYPWYDYQSLTKKLIVNGEVNNIGFLAFFAFRKLESLTIGNGVKIIGDYAFEYCESLKSVVIPESVTEIGSGAFDDCVELADITVHKNIKKMGSSPFDNSAFYNNSSNWEDGILYLENYLISVKKGTFEQYSVKEGTTIISAYAFYNDETLKSITLPSSLSYIGSDAFYECTSLSSIEFPDNLKGIGTYAFCGCTSLKSIEIPRSVEEIGKSAFNRCESLEYFVVDKDNRNYSSDEFGVLFNKDKTELIVFPPLNSNVNYNIPSGVKTIKDYAFNSCVNLVGVKIPHSVINIEAGAFCNCSSLEEIAIPNGVEVVSEWAFYGCRSLEKVKIPDTVTTISEEAFRNCENLEEIYLPSSINIYGNRAFAYCYNLSSFVVSGKLSSIGTSVFYRNSNLKTVFIPNSIKKIGPSAFGYTSLTDIYFEGSEEEWNNISVEYQGDYFENVTIHYNSKLYDVCYDANGGELNVISDQQKIGTVDTEVTDVIPEKSFTVIFDANGGQAETTSKKLDSTFENWNTALNGSGTSYQPGDAYTEDKDITLYAQWDDPKIGALEIPTREGYYFDGWYTDPYEGTKVTETSVVSSDMTLYAHWNKLEVTGVKWVSKPAKTEYIVGETLDTEGAEITATFNSGETKTIPLDEIEFYPTEFDRAGKKIIKASYGEKYVSFIVNVSNKTLISASVTNLPDKLTYTVGESLDTTGLELNAVYTDSSIKTVTEGFTVTCDLSSAGTKTVTVEYTENGVTVSTSYQITVNPKVTQPNAVISVNSLSATAGETISVPFRAEKNSGFMGFGITVDYDSDAFTPVSVAPGAMLGNGTLNDSIGTAYEYLKIVYVGSEDVTGDGALFTVDFLVNENASGNYGFDVSFLQPDTFNESLDDVIFECNDFDVTVSNTAVEQSVVFTGGSVDTNAGTTVVVPVSVENGVGINSFSFKMDYNSEVMSFVSASNGDVITDGKVNSSINESYDEISLSWSGSPITTDGVLFYVTFEIDEYIQSYEILSVLCENITFANEITKDVICIDAEVNIFNPNGGNSPVIFSKDYLRIEDSIIEVPVYIKNNYGLMGLGLNIEYDSSVITPVSVTASDMLSAGYFVNNIGLKDGSFKVLWNHTEDISDNGLLLTLKFSAADGVKPETVPLSITYSQPDTYNEKWEDVSLNIKISEIGISYIYTATFMHNGEVVGTDEFFPDDESLDYPVIPEKPYYEWVWDEHEILAEDITVEGRYVPVEFTISYYNGSVLVATDKYTVETTEEQIVLPEVPEKEGYSGEWESFELGTSDINVNCIYTPIVYTATFMHNGKVIGTDKFTVEDDVLDCPGIAPREHYEWEWDEYNISAADLSVEGRYVPIEYIINFVSNGQTVKTQNYTVETQDSISAPEFSLPEKEGYYSEWESWEGRIGNLTVNEIYVAREYTISFCCDGQIISQSKFTVETNADEIDFPEVPNKTGYSGKWEDFIIAANNIEVDCVYTPVVYTATFINDGKVIGTDTFTVEDESFDYPYIAKWANYDWVWDEHKIEAGNLTIEGRYVPITYTITFVSNGKVVKTQEYNVNTVDSIVAPVKSLPVKQHYTSEWEDWSGKIGNITVNEVYVPIKYKISFYRQDKLVATRTYTIETSLSQIIIPEVPKVEGYTVKWPELSLAYKDQSVYAICTPVIYTAQFVADGRLIATRTFTVETEMLNEPAVPQKAGYIAAWSGYVIKAENMIIHAKYYPPEVVMKAKVTLQSNESTRLLTSCNFETTGKSWTSSNPSVATVDNHGNVTAVGKGECEITVVCYGKDSFENEIKATNKTEIVVKEQLNTKTLKERFRSAFDEFFEVKLHDFMENLKRFMLVLFRCAY